MAMRAPDRSSAIDWSRERASSMPSSLASSSVQRASSPTAPVLDAVSEVRIPRQRAIARSPSRFFALAAMGDHRLFLARGDPFDKFGGLAGPDAQVRVLQGKRRRGIEIAHVHNPVMGALFIGRN